MAERSPEEFEQDDFHQGVSCRLRLAQACNRGAEGAEDALYFCGQLARLGEKPLGFEARCAIEAVAKGLDPQASCLQTLLENGLEDPIAEALAVAATRGALSAVLALMRWVDATGQESLALRKACGLGHEHCARALLGASDPAAKNWEALSLAASGGHAACVELLAALAPRAALDDALVLAAHRAHPTCCEALTPWASEQGVARALEKLQGPRPQPEARRPQRAPSLEKQSVAACHALLEKALLKSSPLSIQSAPAKSKARI
jgi:hypothetical protein